MAVAIQQLNVRLQQQETAMTKSMSNTPRQRVQAGVAETRVIGKPDQFDGDPMKYAGWSFKLRSYFGAVDPRYRSIVDTETQRKSLERRKHTDVLHSGDDNCRSCVGQVSQCRRERRVRGLEAVRDVKGTQTSDEVCGTPDERVGCTDSETTFQPS